MQEHVELEVSLEIIMARIAQSIFDLSNNNSKENVNELKNVISLQEEAYKGDRDAIEKILNK